MNCHVCGREASVRFESWYCGTCALVRLADRPGRVWLETWENAHAERDRIRRLTAQTVGGAA